MEENLTSWKNHSFTLMIFVGIVVLSSIFFVLGMIVGRSQGKHAAEVALADQSSRKPSAESGTEDFPPELDNPSREQKPANPLQPIAEASAQPLTPNPPPPAPKNAPKPPPEPKTDKTEVASPKPAASKPPPKPEAKPPASKTASAADQYLQVFASKSEKGATAEMKKVQSKGFKAKIRPVKANGGTLYYVVVGPYKDSEIKGAKAELQAKGYKSVIAPK